MDLTKPEHCLTAALQRAARAVGRGFEAAARDAGLTAPQFNTLGQLDARGEMALGDLAEVMGTDRTTLTRNLDVMAAQGWITAVDADDRRLRIWRLTGAGRERLAAAMPGWTAWQTGLVDRLGADEASALLRALARL